METKQLNTDAGQQLVKSKRLESLDVLRGFDMFWIIGGSQIFRELWKDSNNPIFQTLREQFYHVEWEGFRFYDLIFPLFLFIIGVAIPFSISKRRQRGDSNRRIIAHILVRVFVLIVLGMIVNGNLLTYDLSNFQITYSVLQMLALGYLVASLVYLYFNLRIQIFVTIGMLLVYWILLAFVPIHGHEIGVFKPGCNFGDWLNDFVLGDLQGQWRFGWILSILGHGSTAMLGVFAGRLLRSGERPYKKVLWLAVLGMACLAAGWIWGKWLPWPIRFPIIKNRWTSTFALFAGGWSFLLLTSFYLIVDVWKLKKWAFIFKVVGMNSITAYMAQAMFAWQRPVFRQAAEVFLSGLQPYVGIYYKAVLPIGSFFILWLILFWMYRKNTFLRI